MALLTSVAAASPAALPDSERRRISRSRGRRPAIARAMGDEGIRLRRRGRRRVGAGTHRPSHGRSRRRQRRRETASAAETEALAADLAAAPAARRRRARLGRARRRQDDVRARRVPRARRRRSPVTSPTFTIARRYEDGRVPVSHLDLFRLAEGLDDEEPELLADELGARPRRLRRVARGRRRRPGRRPRRRARAPRARGGDRRRVIIEAMTAVLGFDTATPDTVVALHADGARAGRAAPRARRRASAPATPRQLLPLAGALLERAGPALRRPRPDRRRRRAGDVHRPADRRRHAPARSPRASGAELVRGLDAARAGRRPRPRRPRARRPRRPPRRGLRRRLATATSELAGPVAVRARGAGRARRPRPRPEPGWPSGTGR